MGVVKVFMWVCYENDLYGYEGCTCRETATMALVMCGCNMGMSLLCGRVIWACCFSHL